MPTTTITLVHTPACHFCTDAQDALTDLAAQYPISIELVAADSATGQSLIARHRPAMFPLVLVEGAFFSVGRLPRRKLRARLDSTPAAVRS
jgi:alkyl hydroperoxide reductase subunit AhpF